LTLHWGSGSFGTGKVEDGADEEDCCCKYFGFGPGFWRCGLPEEPADGAGEAVFAIFKDL